MVEFNQAPEGHFVQGIGGDTSNCAVAAARQGAGVAYVTRVGVDPFGNSLIRLWQNEGIDVSGVVRDEKAPTGIYFVTHDDCGHHFTYYRRQSAASLLSAPGLPRDLIASARILHVSAISQAISQSATEAVRAAIDIANENGTITAYDTNLRLNLWPLDLAREVIHDAMRHCRIALPSYDDARDLTGRNDPDEIVDFYLDLGAEIVALKQGARGVLLATPEMRRNVPACAVDAIDANAAGDTFAGTFLAEYARTSDTVRSAIYGNAAAALSTCSPGAVTSIPERKQVEEFISALQGN